MGVGGVGGRERRNLRGRGGREGGREERVGVSGCRVGEEDVHGGGRSGREGKEEPDGGEGGREGGRAMSILLHIVSKAGARELDVRSKQRAMTEKKPLPPSLPPSLPPRPRRGDKMHIFFCRPSQLATNETELVNVVVAWK